MKPFNRHILIKLIEKKEEEKVEKKEEEKAKDSEEKKKNEELPADGFPYIKKFGLLSKKDLDNYSTIYNELSLRILILISHLLPQNSSYFYSKQS